MSFDEEPDAPLHGECAHAIHELQAQLAASQAECEKQKQHRAEDIRDLFERGKLYLSERDAARAEVERLRTARDTILNYWWPRLGYKAANEMSYPALGDSRATVAPLVAEVEALQKERDGYLDTLRDIAREHAEYCKRKLLPEDECECIHDQQLARDALAKGEG